MLTRISSLLLILVIAGCTFTVPIDPHQPNNPDVKPIVDEEHAPAAEIWRALAHRVEMGTVDTPKNLCRLVRELRTAGELSESDQVKFDSEFPNATTDESELDAKKTSARLRGIK